MNDKKDPYKDKTAEDIDIEKIKRERR